MKRTIVILQFLLANFLSSSLLAIDIVERDMARDSQNPSALGLDKDRADYLQGVERKLKRWERVSSTLKKGANLTPSKERREIERLANVIQKDCKRVKEDIDDLKLAPADNWQGQKKLIDTRLTQMQKHYRRILAE